jgi:hypothetical protein
MGQEQLSYPHLLITHDHHLISWGVGRNAGEWSVTWFWNDASLVLNENKQMRGRLTRDFLLTFHCPLLTEQDLLHFCIASDIWGLQGGPYSGNLNEVLKMLELLTLLIECVTLWPLQWVNSLRKFRVRIVEENIWTYERESNKRLEIYRMGSNDGIL